MSRHFLTPVELGDRWSVSVQALANWRSNGGGPEYVKIGTRVRYAVGDVERYEDAHAITPQRSTTRPTR